MSEDTKLIRSIFDTESEDQVKSPEKLDDYIRVSTPRIWIFTFALCLLTVGFLFWGFYGKIPINMMVKGVGISETDLTKVKNTDEIIVSEIICLVDSTNNTSSMLEDKVAHVSFRDGNKAIGRAYLYDTTLQKDEEVMNILERYNVDYQWVYSQLGTGGYRYIVKIILDEPIKYLYWGDTCDVSITVNEVSPISLLLE
jgi:hypothetical protein